MQPGRGHEINRELESLAHRATVWAGTSWAFLIASVLVIVWVITGPIFRFTDTWQLVMNTISSIVTFLMVFLLQRSQNKDSLAMQVKLNELVGAVKGASNRVINVEDLTEDEVQQLHDRYQKLAEMAQQTNRLQQSVSIEQCGIESPPRPDEQNVHVPN